MRSLQGQPIAPRVNTSWCFSRGAAALAGPLGDKPIMPPGTIRDGGVATIRKKISEQLARDQGNNLDLVLDIGLRTVAAGGGFGVPLAVGGFVFDRLGSAGHALLGGGAPGGGKCRGMGRERFGKHAIDGIGPAAVVLDDFVGDVGHWGTRSLLVRGAVTGGERVVHSMTK